MLSSLGRQALADLVDSVLFAEASKDREELLETGLGDQRGEDPVDLAEFDSRLEIEEPCQSRLEHACQGLHLLLEDLNELGHVIVLHGVKHRLDVRLSCY